MWALLLKLIPWDLVAKGVMGIINLIIKDKEKRDEYNKRFLEFIKYQDPQVYSSLALRDQYDSIIRQIELEEEEKKKASESKN